MNTPAQNRERVENQRQGEKLRMVKTIIDFIYLYNGIYPDTGESFSVDDRRNFIAAVQFANDSLKGDERIMKLPLKVEAGSIISAPSTTGGRNKRVRRGA